MSERRAPMDPGEAARSFAARLEAAGLPRFVSAEHDAELDMLKVTWSHGVTLYMDLTREDIVEPIDAHARAVILGLRPCCDECATIDVYVPGSPDDPRTDGSVPGIAIHPGPPPDPDDVTAVNGIPVTSPSRTLIDLLRS